MNNILRTTAMASILAIAAVSYSTASSADSNSRTQKCIGDACAGQGMDNDNGQMMQNQNGQSDGNDQLRKLRKKGVQSNDQYQNDNGDNDSNDQLKKLRKKGVQSNDQYQDNNGDNSGNDQLKKLRKKGVQSNDQYQDNNGNGQMGSQKKMRHADWKYDNNRHQRRRSKDARFRFYFGGFYYPQPYWDNAGYVDAPYRISCGEGRDIVSERFNRVRVVECSGRTFTYVGRRNGNTFQVVLSSRSGRVISADEI